MAGNNKNYLSGEEIRAIARENKKTMRRLEANKYRKADESEYLTQMKNNDNTSKFHYRCCW